ncbi:tyrosine-type recombinase/integrase [Micromonospora sp. NPDC049366]|uniref:tyrosine-type recombinase/integrase n=1 Tax=Micromonospora sp. NPDC049366 TaxID=3364271 RepID=UPI0037BB641C
MTDAVKVALALIELKRNPNTKEAYSRDLFGCAHPDPTSCEHPDPKRQPNPYAWLRWCAARSIDPLRVHPVQIEAWQRDLELRARESGSTRARRLGAVQSYYKLAFRLDKVPFNPVDKLDPNQRPERRAGGTTGTALDGEQRLDLIDAADSSSVRDAALIAVALYTGLRASELAGINIEDISVQGRRMVITVKGKGSKHRRVWLNAEARQRVERLLAQPRPDTEQLPAVAAGGRPEPRPLFLGKRGKRMSRQTIYDVVEKLTTGLGLPQRIGVHDLRRTFGTSANKVTDLNTVRIAMGHADVKTTTVYIHGDPSEHPGELIGDQDAELRRRRAAATVSEDED